MAMISYVNDVLPIGGRSFNPSFDEVLDTTPVTGATNANLYELINNNGGAFNGFKVQFTSNVNNGAGDFTYTTGKPSGGTITGLFLRAPDGTVIAQVTIGTNTIFGNNKLQDFYNKLTNPGTVTSKDAIFSALNSLFNNNNVINGSPVADHLTAYGGSSGEVFGNGGNDVLWSPGFASRKLVGGAGNDVIRVERGTYEVHGGNADGTGGAGTDTLEIVGYYNSGSSAYFNKLTNIDVLRFVVGDQSAPGSTDGTYVFGNFNLSKIGLANLPSTLTVHGTAGTPRSQNGIHIYMDDNPAATTGVTIDLSGWSFKTWDEKRSEVSISTNSAKALKDVVTGTTVADKIYTFGGDDTIRGGKGADYMDGGEGNDTFIFGKGEAAPGESVNGGGYGTEGGTADRILLLGDNDFSKAWITGVEILAFGGAATATFNQFIVSDESEMKTIQGDGNSNTLAIKMTNYGYGAPAVDLSDLVFKNWSANDKVTITGTKSADSIAGSTQGDIINGGRGSDNLQGNEGADTFVFDLISPRGVDRIADFSRKEGDTIELIGITSAKLNAGKLAKSAFQYGLKADDKKDRILYDKDTGILRYDDDGSGKHKAKIIAVLEDAATLKAADIFLI